MQGVIIAVTRILSNLRIDPYNTKLILSCLKQTLTLESVTPTIAKTPQEADGAEEALAAKAAAVVEAIAEKLNC